MIPWLDIAFYVLFVSCGLGAICCICYALYLVLGEDE